MRRKILAISAIFLLFVAIVISLWWPNAEGTLAFCWRMGAILAAAWLAFDDVQRLPNWLLLTIPVLLIVLVRWPRQFWLLIPLLIGWAILRRFLQPIKNSR
jgi:hypothetical protein